MYQYSVLVAGNSETSRANVEALMEDHYHANSGKTGVLVVAFVNRPSSGQIWAAQAATSLGLPIVVFGPDEDTFSGLPKSTYTPSKSPHKDAAAYIKSESESPEAFLLWSDDDNESANALAHCKQYGIPALDFCQGLMAIHPAEELTPEAEPSIPKEEAVTSKEPDEEGLDDEEYEEYEDDEELEPEDEENGYADVSDALLTVIDYIADLVADSVIQKLEERKSDIG